MKEKYDGWVLKSYYGRNPFFVPGTARGEMKEKIKIYLSIIVVIVGSFFIGFMIRGLVDTKKQLQLDLDKTEIRLRADQVDEILSLVEDLIVIFKEYGSDVNEILTYRDGELENRIRFREGGK